MYAGSVAEIVPYQMKKVAVRLTFAISSLVAIFDESGVANATLPPPPLHFKVILLHEIGDFGLFAEQKNQLIGIWEEAKKKCHAVDTMWIVGYLAENIYKLVSQEISESRVQRIKSFVNQLGVPEGSIQFQSHGVAFDKHTGSDLEGRGFTHVSLSCR